MLSAGQHWSSRSHHHGFSSTSRPWDLSNLHRSKALSCHLLPATTVSLFLTHCTVHVSAPPDNSCPSKETATPFLISEGSGLDPSSIRKLMGRVSNPPLPKEKLTSHVKRFLILLKLTSHFHAKGQLSLINKFIIQCPVWHVLFVLPQARSTASSTAV